MHLHPQNRSTVIRWITRFYGKENVLGFEECALALETLVDSLIFPILVRVWGFGAQPWKAYGFGYKTLPTYIRNKIDYPDSQRVYTDAEFESAILLLRKSCGRLRGITP